MVVRAAGVVTFPAAHLSQCLHHARSISPDEPVGLHVWTERPSLIATMQSVALYDGEVCLGGAKIVRRGPSLFEDCKRDAGPHTRAHVAAVSVGESVLQGGREDAFATVNCDRIR